MPPCPHSHYVCNIDLKVCLKVFFMQQPIEQEKKQKKKKKKKKNTKFMLASNFIQIILSISHPHPLEKQSKGRK